MILQFYDSMIHSPWHKGAYHGFSAWHLLLMTAGAHLQQWVHSCTPPALVQFGGATLSPARSQLPEGEAHSHDCSKLLHTEQLKALQF